MTTNQQRIIDISRKLGLSHIGSNLSCLPILEEIYKEKKPEDIVILDNAHAHLSHLVVRDSLRESMHGEKLYNAEYMIEQHGIHCERKAGCDASGGSLGHGLGIGIGYALSDRERNIHVIVSDGSMMEGSGYEAIRIASELKLKNLHIYANFNGFTAVAKIDERELHSKMLHFYDDVTLHMTSNTEGFEGVGGHYKVIK